MAPDPACRDVLLVAADLNERRLLFGELLEAGYDVLPLPGLSLAIGELLQGLVKSRLIVIDVQGDEHATPESVDYLLTLAPDTPSLLVVGAINSALWEPLRPRVAALLRRPITIGKVIDAVRRTLPMTKE